MKKPIIVEVKSGLIEVLNLPLGLVVEVRDYDVEGIDIANISSAYDKDGNLYLLETFIGGKNAQTYQR